jgi:ribosomal protein S18 acetylase RimI-like enzyme
VLVHHVVATCEAAELGEAQVDLEDIRSDWRRPEVDVPNDGIIVLDEAGEAAAYAELCNGRAEGNVLPAYRGRGIGAFLAAWIEARAREVGAEFVRQIVPAGAEDRLTLLARAGYERSDTAWELEIALPARIERPASTAALEIREFRPGVDDEAVFELVEAAFGHWPNRQPNTLEGWRALTVTRAGFEPWLLPLVWDSGEQLVGAAYCIDYPEDDFTWIQQLAVRVDRQGNGIGTLLLAECFARFAARGRTSAGLSTDSRTGALGLYQRVGMHVIREFAGHALRVD